MLNQAVIFCGGLGTRLLPLTKILPKPMVLVNGRPFLYHLIMQSKSNGINNFLILFGYKHELIEKYFGNGKKFGVRIKYHYNHQEVLTLKRLLDAKHLLKDSFLLLYADNYASLNLHDLIKKKKKYKSKFIISVCKKSKGNGNTQLDKKNKLISKYSFKKVKNYKYVEIGYAILDKTILPNQKNYKNISFNFFIHNCVKKKVVNYYFNDTNYLSISDIARLKITRKFFNKKVVLLDRDGVINYKNKKHFYVRSLNELRINKNFIKAYYDILKDKKIICITNQAGIATGDVSKKKLHLINKKIISEYRNYKLNIVDFFISKHHFTSSHIDRKPGHGLFLKAAKKYNFILDKTFYIGDDLRDVQASYNAKTKCIYLGKSKLQNKARVFYKTTLINKRNFKNYNI